MALDVTSYVGREREADEARRLLRKSRVVTLIGPGGVGKTRLAKRIATTIAGEFPDGVALVELAEWRNPDLLANKVSDGLGIYDHSVRSALDLIIDHLQARPRSLLVLDNCEHLIDECARLISALISACPRLTVLTTSRQSLIIHGEQLLPVPPLSTPDPDLVAAPADLEPFEAPRLFAERAKSIVPGFTVDETNFRDVATLCRDLDGLPLAIELAVVRLRSLSVTQIQARLTSRLSLLTLGQRQAPKRQQTIRGLIDWSYELLTAPERLVLARASVFSGGFDLAAAEQVCGGAGVEPAEMVDLVHDLVDKSLLIRVDEPGTPLRFQMLDTVREYGKDRLDQAGDTARVARRHRDWYAAITDEIAVGWTSGDQGAWLRRVSPDHDNLRTALAFCLSDPDEVVVGLRMIHQLDVYWAAVGLLNEARIWLEKALAAAPPDEPLRVQVLRVLAQCAIIQGDLDACFAALAEGREVADRVTADEISTAYLDGVLGLAHLFVEKGDLARAELTRSFGVFRRHGYEAGESYVGYMLAMAMAVTGDVAEGKAFVTERIKAHEATGDVFWRSWELYALSMIELLYGDVRAAEAAARQAFGLLQVVSNRSLETYTLVVLACVAALDGDYQRAATLSGVGTTMWKALGANPVHFGEFTTRQSVMLGSVAQEYGREEYTKHFREGRSWPRDEAVRYVLDNVRPTEPGAVALTKRESQVAAMVADGMSNKEIAAKLFIAPRTVESHVDHILTKLDLKSRAQITGRFADR